MQGFYWVVEDVLAGCPRPGGQQRGRPVADDAALDRDLAWLYGRGIRAVISLTEEPLPDAAFARHGLDALHIPVDDLSAPAPEQLHEALGFIDWHVAHERAVVAHCLMGQGRTGTVLAAWLIRDGMSPTAALAHLRALCPGAVGSPPQERALECWGRQRGWFV